MCLDPQSSVFDSRLPIDYREETGMRLRSQKKKRNGKRLRTIVHSPRAFEALTARSSVAPIVASPDGRPASPTS